jgi:hypothetical protein
MMIAYLMCLALEAHSKTIWKTCFTLDLVFALRPQTPKHIRGGWSHYTDTSNSVDGNGAQNMVTVQSGFEATTF